MMLLLLLFASSHCSLQFVQWQALMDIYNQTSEICDRGHSRFRFVFLSLKKNVN